MEKGQNIVIATEGNGNHLSINVIKVRFYYIFVAEKKHFNGRFSKQN